MSERSFFSELKRRHVYRVAAAYAVVAWLVVQVVTIIFPAFNAPPWVLKVIIGLIALGFPIAVALAWAFERDEETARVEDRRLAVVILLGGILAVALFVFSFSGLTSIRSAHADAGNKSIAVLPFENLSGEPEDAFFADGIQDDLITSLAKIQELKVISRSSAGTYRNAPNRDLRQIGRELGVANVLEGRVRRTKDRVLVNVSLVDTGDGHQVWAERYDRTLANSLTLQGELATEIASALRARLTPEEKARVAAKPTDNPDAYVLYLRGRDYQTRPIPLREDNETALRLYSEAIALDPKFALAHARRSAAFSYRHLYFEPTTEVEQRARAEAEEALRLQPDLGEGHLSRALWFYWTQKDYENALRELEIAGRLIPNDVEVESIRGYIRRRQGRWADALAALQQSITRDPRNAQIAGELFGTRYAMRDWPEAARAGELAMALSLDLPTVRVNRSYIDFYARGDLNSVREALAAVPEGLDPDGSVTLAKWDAALLGNDFAAAEQAVYASKAEAARTVFGASFNKDYLLGCIALARGDVNAARPLLEAAVPWMENEVRAAPLDAFRHGHLGLLCAYLGRKEDALREGQYAVKLLPIEKDGYDGTFISALLALIYARTGENDRALEMVQRLLTLPGPVMPFYEASITQMELRTRWQWAPLRNDPRFQQLLSGSEPKTN